jgi:hypothetical protein
MPADDAPNYPAGHFQRVYEHVLAPAARAAGFVPTLASDPTTDVAPASVIVLDGVRRALDADVVLCDLSARDPAVLYALGLRQAFDTPVTLVKDRRTPRVFDVPGLRDVAYDETLRVDTVATAVQEIGAALRAAYDARETGEARAAGASDVASVTQWLALQPARTPAPSTLSGETQLLLTAIRQLGERVARLEERGVPERARPSASRLSRARQSVPFGDRAFAGRSESAAAARTRARFRRLAGLVSTLDAGQSFTLDELVGPALSDDEAGVLAQALAALGMAEPIALGAVRPHTRLRRLGDESSSNQTRYFLRRDFTARA